MEREFQQQFKDEIKEMNPAQRRAFMADRIRPLVQVAGLERIKRKAYTKFGKIVGKKAATWLAGAAIGGAACAPAGGVGAAPGAVVGLVVSTAINIAGAAADVYEICSCAWKCK